MSEPRIYRIIRFYKASYRQRTIRQGLTLTEAQEHCSRKDTRGAGWFDGYDYMKHCKPAEGDK